MIAPQFLKPGDKVGIVSTAKKVDKALLVKGTEVLSKWGLEVLMGEHVYNGQLFLAGKDGDRLKDLNAMIENPSIKAIFCSRGGYGTGRILGDIHFDELLKNPKWIIGFSDITILHLRLTQLGLPSIHGPMPAIYHKTEMDVLNQLKGFLFEGKSNPINAKSNKLNRNGTVEGVVTGGNLAMICSSLGTDFEIETANKILFIEDIDEPLYKIDRMLHQMKSARKLSNLTGLILGHFTYSGNSESFDFSLEEIVRNLTDAYNYPIGFDLPIGHEPGNYSTPLNYPVKLEISPKGTSLSF